VIFAELGHAGSQSRDPDIEPLAPSPVKNFISARAPREASEREIEGTVEKYGAAARRAVEAGFDGIHIHAGHGYLISEFSSPHGNRRSDGWGGDASRRSRFVLSIYAAVRTAVGSDFPISIKLGMADSMESGGLQLPESIGRAVALEQAGIDAIEVSVGIMHQLTKSAGRFVGLGLMRALQDMAFHRLFQPATPEAYFLPFARALKPHLKRIPLILVGGIRSTDTMLRIREEGAADFLSMARPFIREPDLPNQILAGRRGFVDCISCNICVEYEGVAPLQCWRIDKIMLLKHLLSQLKRGRLPL
jgi:2,4-dienoyl-CoA reductase-like NADH-dependent reductase (Old Yellow Enzyme family)